MDFKTMLQLPVLDTNAVINILQEIADIERHEERPQMPQVTISTHSDNASGFFVNYDSEKKTILLCDMYDRKAQFIYIEAHAISSISLRNVDKYGYLLSDGNIPFVPTDDEIPTVLQLKKEVKALEEEVKVSFAKEISVTYKYEGTPGNLDKFYASKVIKLLQKTFSNVAADSLAKSAFTEAVSKVNFSLGSDNTSAFENGELNVIVNTTKGLKSFPKANQLQEQIEKFL